MVELLNIKIVRIATICTVYWGLCEAGLRILGGRDALKNEFPFAVKLEIELTKTDNGKTYIEYQHFCTGAALTSSWILTAAHCGDDTFYKIAFNELLNTHRKFARHNSYFPKYSGQLSLITKVIIYPGFMFSLFNSKKSKNDLALFQTENILVSQYGKISAIDYTALEGHEVVALGFSENNDAPRKKPLQVLKALLTKCDVREGRLFGYVCIVPRCGPKAQLCGGDSGGPVVHATGIIGVNSLSNEDCKRFSRGLFHGYAAGAISVISPAVDWISKIISNKNN